MEMKGDILAVVEHTGEEVDALSLEIVARGRDLADRAGCRLKAILLGPAIEKPVRSLLESGPDTVFVAESPQLDLYNPELYAGIIEDVIKSNTFSLILLGYTFMGMEMGPALATRMRTRLFSNCVDLDLSADGIVVTRPMYGGMIYTQSVGIGAEPTLVSIQSGASPRREVVRRAPAEVIPVPVKAGEATCRTRALDILHQAEGGVDLRRADIIVAAGRGIGDRSNLRLIEELADALGGAVGCSRPLVDNGWLPGNMQIGISGHAVHPKVYIACGISGASQHVAGMRDSQMIIAINSDPKAPIFRVAHYGVVGDVLQVVPAIIERAQELKLGRGGND